VKGLQYTVLVIALAILSSQTIHYIYMKFFYPTTSVLDTPLDTDIQQAKSLDELVKMYRKSEADVEAFEDQLAPEDRRDSNRWEDEPYKSKNALRSAISDWEEKNEQYRRLLVQWTYGLLIALVGIGAYTRRHHWVGTALVLAGLGEMLWWCSPSIDLGGAQSEFDRLLNTKLILSLVTAAVLALTWRVWTRVRAAVAA
jgi:hypothetical protein